jgi:ABC-type transport system substrate-binding protein
MRRKKALVVVSVAALTLGLAACSGSSDDDNGGGGNPSGGFSEGADSGSDKDPAAVGPAPDVEGAKTGGEITVLTPDPDDGPADMDPASLWSVTGNAIAQDLLFRSLTQFRRDPGSGQYVLVPDLATDLGRPNEDFTEWRFTLKDGIAWETGDPVTAEEVAFGIKRSFDEDTFPTGPGSAYSNPYFAGGKDYTGPYSGGEDFPAVTVEGNDIVLKMDKPFSEMDYYASMPAIGPVPLDAVAPEYGLHPLSTGPYKVEKFTPNQELVLVKNDQWDPDTDPARRQHADKYTFEFDVDASVADQTVLSDNAEGATTIVTSMLAQDYTAAVQGGNEAKTNVGSTPCTNLSMPSYTKIPELEVRQALAFAYPYEDAWAAAGELPGVTLANGVTDPALGFGFLPPGMAGRTAWAGEIDGETVQYDPEHAKELLAKAGYAPGEYEAAFAYDSSSPEGKAAMEQTKLAYQEAGFDPKPYPYGAGSLYDVWTDPDNAIYKKINILGTSWCQDWPSASTFLPVVLGTDSPYNTGGFSEPEVDAEIERIQNELPIEEQADAWGALEQKIMTDYMPVINRGYINVIAGVGSDIGGYVNDSALGGAPDYREIYVK